MSSSTTGLLLISDIASIRVFQHKTPTRDQMTAFAMVLTGHYDDQIKAGAEMLGQNANNILQRSKEAIRSYVQAIINDAVHINKLNTRKNVAKVVQEIQEIQKSSKPHEMGTVSELATKFGVSKSEIRRRKADSTLCELTV